MTGNRNVLKLRDGKFTIIEEEREVKKEKEKNSGRLFRAINLATELGFVIAFPIVGGAIFGSLIDKKLNTGPKGTLSFIFIGLVISLFQIVKITKKFTGD